MDHLSEEQVHALRRLLDEERQAILARAGTFVAESAGFVVDSGDQQDRAALEAARSAVARLASHDRQRLGEVEAALERLRDGTYGLCEESDDPIPFGRLRLQPTARLTIEAQEDLERAAARSDDRGEAY